MSRHLDDPRVAEQAAIFARGERPNLPAIPVNPGVRDGRVIIPPGDPRYCWNGYPHDPHAFHYTLDDGLRGGYDCDGVTPWLWLRDETQETDPTNPQEPNRG